MPPLLSLLAQMMTVTHVLFVLEGKDKASSASGKYTALRVIVVIAHVTFQLQPSVP